MWGEVGTSDRHPFLRTGLPAGAASQYAVGEMPSSRSYDAVVVGSRSERTVGGYRAGPGRQVGPRGRG